jgi:4-hydroxy-3-polyprenylbenzoate decarboxylase
MDTRENNRAVVGITGASGALYARRVVEQLTAADVETHLAITPLGRRLLHDELGMKRVDLDALSGGRGGLVHLHRDNDLGAAIASGSFLHRGMVVVPASSNTLGAIASGTTLNLVHRAALVTLKEGRTLVIAHRESPLSRIDLQNMVRCADAGAIIAPLNPGFYLGPRSIDDIVDFMAGKLLDLLGVPHDLDTRWDEHLARTETEDGD